jgi:hypothetical protein
MDRTNIVMFITKWEDLGQYKSNQDYKEVFSEILQRCIEIEFPRGYFCSKCESKDPSDFVFDSIFSAKEERKLLSACQFYFSRYKYNWFLWERSISRRLPKLRVQYLVSRAIVLRDIKRKALFQYVPIICLLVGLKLAFRALEVETSN